MIKTEEIYIYLLDEGIDVWRPVDANKIDENLYKITSIGGKEITESLEFTVGDVVKTIDKVLVEGSGNDFGKKILEK